MLANHHSYKSTCTQRHRYQMLQASNSTGTSHSLQATSRISSSQTVSCSNRSSEWISGVKKSNLHRWTDHIPGQIIAISQSICYWGCTQHWPYYLVECNETKWSEFWFCGSPTAISSIICINRTNLLKLWSNSQQSQEQTWQQHSIKVGVLLPSTEGRCWNWQLMIWILTLSHYIMYVHHFLSHFRNVHVKMF